MGKYRDEAKPIDYGSEKEEGDKTDDDNPNYCLRRASHGAILIR